MDLNKTAVFIQDRLAAALSDVKLSTALADGDVLVQETEITENLLAVLMHVGERSRAQEIQIATGFSTRRGPHPASGLLEFSVLTITITLPPTESPERAIAAGGESSELRLLIQSVMASGGELEVKVPASSRVHLKIWLPCSYEDRLVTEVKNGKTVLLVEDEDFVRGVTREVLEMEGYQVLEATNADDAIALFNENDGKVDLVLTDVVMPGMNGRDLAELLANGRPALKTIYMSGYTENAVLRRGLEKDSSAYLQKPFALETLIAKVREILGTDHPSGGAPAPHRGSETGPTAPALRPYRTAASITEAIKLNGTDC
jgi:CheY-like chemotaxis protein